MIRKITADRPLKVLGFTDTHFDGNYDCYVWALRLMRETIEAEKPDLVLFVGDNVTGGDNGGRAEEFAQVMTQLKTPWAPVLGNHEGDNPESIARSEMINIFRKSPYCLIPEGKTTTADGRELFGDTNYAVSLYNEDGKVCHKLIFLDGGDEMSEEDKKRLGFENPPRCPYDYLKEEQIAWYREEVRKDDCPSMVFCHIPLPEFWEAVEQGELLAGAKRENICSPLYNSGMFDAMVEEGKSIAFIAGHDHINDFRILYKGIQCIYNRMGGLSSYNVISKKQGTRLMQGCSVYTIDVQGNVSFGDVIYADRFPQYYDSIYAIVRK